MMIPLVVVDSDFDGYFERLVRSWIALKVGPCKHSVIRISAGAYRSAAVSYHANGEQIHLDFYAALRAGFGQLTNEDVTAIVELL